MEETTKLRMLVSGLTVGTGYLLGGIIPLLPYLIITVSQISYSSFSSDLIVNRVMCFEPFTGRLE